MNRPRWVRLAAVAVIVVVVLFAAGSFLIEQSVVEYYSRDWQSRSTEDAKRRGVFVTVPTVTPAAVAVSDSVEARVADAWVERPTHVVYRWYLLRRVVVDSGYRLVVHLVKGPVAGQPSTLHTRECFAYVELYLDGRSAGSGGDFRTDILTDVSRSPVPDTVHLSARRHAPVSQLPGAAPSPVPDCA
jgi:hypothetical protein